MKKSFSHLVKHEVEKNLFDVGKKNFQYFGHVQLSNSQLDKFDDAKKTKPILVPHQLAVGSFLQPAQGPKPISTGQN